VSITRVICGWCGGDRTGEAVCPWCNMGGGKPADMSQVMPLGEARSTIRRIATQQDRILDTLIRVLDELEAVGSLRRLTEHFDPKNKRADAPAAKPAPEASTLPQDRPAAGVAAHPGPPEDWRANAPWRDVVRPELVAIGECVRRILREL
jgi:hypothetical protein